MYDAPDNLGDDMRVTVQVSIGTGIDNTAADDVTSVTAESMLMCGPDPKVKLFNAIYAIDQRLATFEAGGFPIDGTTVFTPPNDGGRFNLDTGLWSKYISDANGNISWTVRLEFAKEHISALSVYTENVVEACTVRRYIKAVDGWHMTRDKALTPNSSIVQDTESTNYQAIEIIFTKIAEARTHVKIAEIEFGASKTISNRQLTGPVRYISEWDPYLRTIPLSEIDFTVINVDGEYDPDNPNRSASLDVGSIVHYSVSVITDGRQVTYPFGRFVITSNRAQGEDIHIVAQDERVLLKGDNSYTWDDNLFPAVNITNLLRSHSIPYVVEPSAMNTRKLVWDENTFPKRDALSVLLYL